ncbi:MAG: SAM-dependent methyltransferase [Betaproteobacteria bacterium HGW-Betaproteobacteria-18]|nr:MAG: SAM-dependent methyltransferase [Betaproteobacteria bacterium HGW-Betaproteobacteria-18]
MQNEIEKIAERYERRKAVVGGRYARFNPEVIAGTQERQRALVSLLKAQGIADLAGVDVLEIGCGSGSNLQELLLLGAKPENLVGNELLPERAEQARHVLPQAVRLFPGDASTLPFEQASFDIVYQSTVFSSILDDALQSRIADAMWRWVRPGGGVLWYDFTFNNPSNPDVRGVPLKRVRELFPQGRISVRRVTLAPPISRRVVRIHPAMYGVFNALSLLRTHVLCFIQKP